MKSLEKGKKNRDKEEAKSVEPRIELFSNAAGLISKALKNKSVERKNDEKNESSEGKSQDNLSQEKMISRLGDIKSKEVKRQHSKTGDKHQTSNKHTLGYF